jgi:hypothetical protein
MSESNSHLGKVPLGNPLASIDFAGVRAMVTARGNGAIIQERVGRSQVPL